MQLLVAILAVVIGLAFAFGGWRFFLLLLPLWGNSAPWENGWSFGRWILTPSRFR